MSEPSPSQLHETVAEQLRRTRQRYTSARRQLVDTLQGLQGPATIAELIGSEPGQSQSSLYRNLAVLEQCGAVRRIASVDDVARYELDEHLTGHHHHLVCTDCGRVEDVDLTADVERVLLRSAEEAGDQRAFTVQSHRVELVGVCADCG